MALPSIVFGALGLARKAATAALDVVRRYPLQCALIASLCLSGWLWRGWNRAEAETAVEIAGRAEDRRRVAAAQVEAARLALAAKAAVEARYRAHAERTERDHQTRLAAAGDDADLFIARNRVRPEALACRASATAPAAQGGGAELPADLPADPVVLGAADVRACAAVTAYAIDAHRWAKGIGGE